MDNVGYAQAVSAVSKIQPSSPHQSALQELGGKIDSLGMVLEKLFTRLDLVSHPGSTIAPANSSATVTPPTSPVPAVAHIIVLTRYVESHLAKVKDATERLAI